MFYIQISKCCLIKKITIFNYKIKKKGIEKYISDRIRHSDRVLGIRHSSTHSKKNDFKRISESP